jgi:hypothetical protein
MVDAIAKGDAQAADDLGRNHTVLFRERVLSYLSESRADEVALS